MSIHCESKMNCEIYLTELTTYVWSNRIVRLLAAEFIEPKKQMVLALKFQKNSFEEAIEIYQE